MLIGRPFEFWRASLGLLISIQRRAADKGDADNLGAFLGLSAPSVAETADEAGSADDAGASAEVTVLLTLCSDSAAEMADAAAAEAARLLIRLPGVYAPHLPRLR